MMTGANYADLFYSKAKNDVAQLTENVKGHPVSQLSQFLLLYHYKKNNDPRFEKLAKQTALYFNNPNWLQFQLAQTDLNYEAQHSLQPELNEEENSFIDTIPEEQNELREEIIPGEPNADNTGFPLSREEKILAFEPKEEVLETDQLKNDAPFENIEKEPLAFEPKEEAEENLPVELTNDDLPVEQEIIPSLPHASNFKTSISSETDEDTVAFEPLHTVDYFASQGIKIREEVLMNDKLGKQMKSFTDWLKSMKKLHPGKLPEQNEVIEKIIQTSAEESNADAEVLTEAMAEVLIKQDKKAKAIEMYQKLSLMNPSKSSYFAAKIESLKTI